MGHTHLTEEERYQIATLYVERYSVTEIAHRLKRHKSTISRELRRNRGERGYRAKQAHKLATTRKSTAQYQNARHIPEEAWAEVRRCLRQYWSPEQTSGYLSRFSTHRVSTERIYLYIYADQSQGGDLYRYLRCQKKRRKRYGSNKRRGNIPNRVGIAHRSPGIESRRMMGDWEADTVIGKNHQSALVTLVERKSRYVVIRWVKRKTAKEVENAICACLFAFKPVVRTITFDNGLEFAHHECVASALDAKTYFADPYSSWQRGTNENTNGLIRQFLPKKTSFVHLTRRDIQRIQDLLNHRPKKCLDFKTPHQVLQDALQRRGVAINS